jgi:hypothetical protein
MSIYQMKSIQHALIKIMALAMGLSLTAAKTDATAQPAIPPNANAPGPILSTPPLTVASPSEVEALA